MKSAETVVFLDHFDDLADALPFVKKARAGIGGALSVVSLNYETGLLSERLDCKIVSFDELLDESDYRRMNTCVFDLTRTWHLGLPRAEGITELDGIKFGLLSEEKMQRFFSFTIKNLELVLKIVDVFHPGKIVLVGNRDAFSDLSGFIKKELGIEAIFLEKKEKKAPLKKILGSSRTMAREAVSCALDAFVRSRALKKNRDNGILIDARLYQELGILRRNFYPYPYLIEKGLRIRLKLLREKQVFLPLFILEYEPLAVVPDRFYRYWKMLEAGTNAPNALSYSGFGIWALARKRIRKLIIYDFRGVKKNIEILREFYGRIGPKVVVLREAVREPERSIVFTAKNAGVPSLVVQHGALAERNVYTALHTDKIAVWGEACARWYGMFGNDIKKCVVTGRPQHDVFYSKTVNADNETEEMLSKKGIPPHNDRILYIANYFQAPKYRLNVYDCCDLERTNLNTILDAARRFPEKQLIIKIHPFDSLNAGALVNSRLRKLPNVFVVKDISLPLLIKKSSLVIASYFSSAALDAVILGKPLIVLSISKTEYLNPLEEGGVAIGARNAQELSHGVRDVLENRKTRDLLASGRERFIRDQAYKIDGMATTRVIDLIKKLYDEAGSFKMKTHKGRYRQSGRRNDRHECIADKPSM